MRGFFYGLIVLNRRHKGNKETGFTKFIERIFESHHEIIIGCKVEAYAVTGKYFIGKWVGADVTVVNHITKIGKDVQVESIIQFTEPF